MNINNAEVVFRGVFYLALKSNNTGIDDLYNIGTRELAEFELLDIMEKIANDRRMELLRELLLSASKDEIAVLTKYIHMIELGYGRFANGQERNFKKVLSLNELMQIENYWVQNIKRILKEYSLFEIDNWRLVFFMLEQLDKKFCKEYLTKAFKRENNIIAFIEDSVEKWRGTRVKYRINNNYEKYISIDSIIKAIEVSVISGNIFCTREETRDKACAFWLCCNMKNGENNEVGQIAVDKQLAEWRMKVLAK